MMYNFRVFDEPSLIHLYKDKVLFNSLLCYVTNVLIHTRVNKLLFLLLLLLLFSCIHISPTVTPLYQTALPPPPLTLGTPKTLDFSKNKGSISIFGHGVRFRKFNSLFHTLGRA